MNMPEPLPPEALSALGPREEALARLLAKTGFAQAQQIALPGDASTRRYARLVLPDRRAILMDAPPSRESPPCPPLASVSERRALGWNALSRLAASRVEAFVAVAGHLSGLGLSAPEILGHDSEAGFAIVEDLGDSLFARVVEQGEDEVGLYRNAGAVLAAVQAGQPGSLLQSHGASWPLLTYDETALAVNADLFVEWAPIFVAQVRITPTVLARWEGVRDRVIAQAMAFPRVLTIRDFHAENLIWLPQRAGLARVGLLDFQDAVLGWAGWDFMMLLQDARRDVGRLAQIAAVQGYLERSGGLEEALQKEIALLGALNSLRLLGLFSRLVLRDGKPRYGEFMPRVWRTLARNLRHPSLEELSDFVETVAEPALAGAR